MGSIDAATARFYDEHGRASVERWESIPADAGVAPFFDVFRPGSSVLDIGCGSGRDLAALSALGHEVYGVEPTAALRARSAALHPELEGRIVAGALPGSIELPSEWPGAFGGIVCSAVLMHVPRPELPTAVRTIHSLLLVGGRVLLSIPNRRGDVADARDPAGRLFTGVTVDELAKLGEGLGLVVESVWSELPDAQGRLGNSWDIAVFGRVR
jgi:SAM-dependent methyltransferase